MIIGICGLIGSGKNTAADYLVSKHNFQQESFAAPLKDAVAAVFGWPRDMLEGATDESRAWREQQDTWWTKRLGMNITPRWILQQWGTDVLREYFHNDIWIASCERRLLCSKYNTVISDCRFPNEAKVIRDAGGIIIRVKRGNDPEWFDSAIKVCTLPAASPYAREANLVLNRANIHVSEVSWVGLEFDKVIINDTTVDDLHAQVDKLIDEIRSY